MNTDKKLGQEPAFATSAFGDGEGVWESGMSKRFYAACAAMQGLLSGGKFAEGIAHSPVIAKMSFEIADELIKQETDV